MWRTRLEWMQPLSIHLRFKIHYSARQQPQSLRFDSIRRLCGNIKFPKIKHDMCILFINSRQRQSWAAVTAACPHRFQFQFLKSTATARCYSMSLTIELFCSFRADALRNELSLRFDAKSATHKHLAVLLVSYVKQGGRQVAGHIYGGGGA